MLSMRTFNIKRLSAPRGDYSSPDSIGSYDQIAEVPLYGFIYTPEVSGLLDKVRFYLETDSETIVSNITAVIFAMEDNSITEQLQQSGAITIPANRADEWTQFYFGGTTPVVKGERYFIGLYTSGTMPDGGAGKSLQIAYTAASSENVRARLSSFSDLPAELEILDDAIYVQMDIDPDPASKKRTYQATGDMVSGYRETSSAEFAAMVDGDFGKTFSLFSDESFADVEIGDRLVDSEDSVEYDVKGVLRNTDGPGRNIQITLALPIDQ